MTNCSSTCTGLQRLISHIWACQAEALLTHLMGQAWGCRGQGDLLPGHCFALMPKGPYALGASEVRYAAAAADPCPCEDGDRPCCSDLRKAGLRRPWGTASTRLPHTPWAAQAHQVCQLDQLAPQHARGLAQLGGSELPPQIGLEAEALGIAQTHGSYRCSGISCSSKTCPASRCTAHTQPMTAGTPPAPPHHACWPPLACASTGFCERQSGGRGAMKFLKVGV